MSKLVIPKATTAARTAATPDAGEIFYDKEEKALYLGDGTAQGGIRVSGPGEATVSALSSGNIVIAHAGFPVGLVTDQGTAYPIEKGTVSRSSGSWVIDPTAYLAYDGSASFTGPWTVYFSAC